MKIAIKTNNPIPETKKKSPQFMLVPSLKCPASCSYCFGPNTGPVMDLGMVSRVVSFIESIVRETGQGKVRITLHGGEPLAAGYDVIESLISSIHNRLGLKNISVGIQSNLWLLDEKYCDLFSKYKVEISTSLDGPMELNDRQRGDCYFEKTMKGIALANSYRMNVNCIATFTSLNTSHWKDIVDFFISQNLHFSVHPCTAPISNKTGLELSPGQYWNLFREMFDYYIYQRKNIIISSFDQFFQGVTSNNSGVCTFRDCFGMFLAVDPNGDIYSCQRFAGIEEYRLGNVTENPSLHDLANNPAGRRFLKREYLIGQKCGECEHYDICKGGCAYNALNKSRELDEIDPYCEAYKKIFSDVKRRLYEEILSEDNLNAISQLGPSERGNPLMRKGPVIELVNGYPHPYFVSRTAKRIIAAFELARGPEISAAALRLADMGISRTKKSAEKSLQSLIENMNSHGRLNKLYLHVTWNCQLRCSHCYACAESNEQTEEMKLHEIEGLVREALDCDFKEIVITGGEPLVYKGRDMLLQVFAALRQEIKPVKLVLRTNFSMPLTDKDLTQIAKAFDEIVISVDGNKQDHDLRRGEGSYDMIVQNLEMYRDRIEEEIAVSTPEVSAARLSLSASMKNQYVNTHSGRAVKDLAEKMRISHVKFRPLLPLGRALDYDEPIEAEVLSSHLSPMELIKEGFNPRLSCGIGQNLYVEPSGKCFPCYAYNKPHAYLGNALGNGLKKVVSNEAFKSLQSHTVDTNIGCKHCEYRYLCGGACRAWGGESSQYDLDVAPADCSRLKKRAEEIYRAALDNFFKGE